MNANLRDFLRITLPVCLLLFILLEIAVRAFYVHQDLMQLTGQEPTVNPMSQWARPHPYASYTALPGKYAEDKTVNSHGFISTPELDQQKKEGVHRILFLGGSATAGTGFNLPDESTWPWQTIEKLRSSTDQPIDFINGALGGYSTFESYGRLWSELIYFDPDIVILNHGWNEFYYFNEIADAPELWRQDFDLQSQLTVESVAPSAIDPYIAWSQLLTKLRLRLIRKPVNNGEIANLKGKSKNLATDFNKQGLELFRRNLQFIRDFCQRKGIQLLVCKQPTLMTATTSAADRKRCSFRNHGFDYEAHLRAYEALYLVIDEEILPSAIIDLSPLSGKTEYFYDHVHPTPGGAVEIADRVALAVTPL